MIIVEAFNLPITNRDRLGMSGSARAGSTDYLINADPSSSQANTYETNNLEEPTMNYPTQYVCNEHLDSSTCPDSDAAVSPSSGFEKTSLVMSDVGEKSSS